MLDNIKKTLKKMIGLWQSEDNNYKGFRDGGIAFIIMSVLVFLFSLIKFNESIIFAYIIRYIFSYVGFLLLLVSINFFGIYYYVYNKRKCLSNGAIIFIILMGAFN